MLVEALTSGLHEELRGYACITLLWERDRLCQA